MFEVVISLALVAILLVVATAPTDVAAQRERENRLHVALGEVRLALSRYRSETGTGPANLGALITTTSSVDGLPYLRRIPLNPLVASTQWQIASRTTGSTEDHWTSVCGPDQGLGDASRILAFRCPDVATAINGTVFTPGTGTNGIRYSEW